MESQRKVTVSFAGFVAGIVGIIIISALLAAAFFSASNSDKTDEAITRLETLYYAQKKSNEQAVERSEASAARGKKLIALAESLRRELRLTKAQLASLSEFLRDQGFDVPLPEPPPPEATPPKGRPGSGPVKPRPSAPASPEPTSPSPASPSPADLACALLPPLCDGLATGLLPLLPKEKP